MTQETVISVIERVCSGKAETTIIGANTTESVYCIIRICNAETKFRISDHYAPKHKRGIRTLVYGKSTKKETVERFVVNVIESLRRKGIAMAFEKIKKKDL